MTATGYGWAEPSVPWAQPQTFPDQNNEESEKPLFERVMEEEKRRKELGIKETVDAESLKTNKVGAKPAPILESFKTLERGANGAQVETVQETLLALGFALPAGSDGDFGGQTESAVKAFQSSVGLPQTGKIDRRSFDLLLGMRPQAGKMVWDDPVAASRSVPKAPSISGKAARVLIDLSEHRLFVYDASGSVQRVFPVAHGAESTPTDTGVKIVCEKMADPTALAAKLWPKSKGTAFGKRLIDLNWYDPETRAETVSDEELHGTYEDASIGSKASHGCVRVSNDNIEWLYQNLSLGDLVVIRE